MEKNIRKRVCRLAAVLSAVLVVLFGYWFFLTPHMAIGKRRRRQRRMNIWIGGCFGGSRRK